MYKAVRRHQEHMGGKDGNDDTDDEDDNEGAAEGEKCKRLTKTTCGRFSKKTLNAFEDSEYYILIDAVCAACPWSECH
jgi:hypothetical protein